MYIYKKIIRPILFILPAEFAHNLVEYILTLIPSQVTKFLFSFQDEDMNINLFGNKLPSPIGIAAGIDKDCKTSHHYINMGFGFSVVGTVMSEPRYGNPKPRLLRIKKDQSIINSLSFPSDGSEKIVDRLKKMVNYKNQLIISVSGAEVSDILNNIIKFQNYCFAIEINISSPNTKNLKTFVNQNSVELIIKEVRKITKIPILFKLPRISNYNEYFDLISVINDHSSVGLVLSNSLPVDDKRLKVGSGGKSGKDLFANTLNALKTVRKEFPNTTIISCGGVSTVDDVRLLIENGANAVQMYSAVVYEGPLVAKDIKNKISFSN